MIMKLHIYIFQASVKLLFDSNYKYHFSAHIPSVGLICYEYAAPVLPCLVEVLKQYTAAAWVLWGKCSDEAEPRSQNRSLAIHSSIHTQRVNRPKTAYFFLVLINHFHPLSFLPRETDQSGIKPSELKRRKKPDACNVKEAGDITDNTHSNHTYI